MKIFVSESCSRIARSKLESVEQIREAHRYIFYYIVRGNRAVISAYRGDEINIL